MHLVRAVSEALTRFLQHNNNPLGLCALGFSAGMEYVFPPFPGDTLTLFGAFLVVRHGWSMTHVFSAVLVGSGAGAMVDFYFGVRMARRYRAGKLIHGPIARQRVERVLAAFKRFGPAYVVINRFLPGVRAVIFVAAGMAGLSGVKVLIYALVSAAIWNAGILALGFTLGTNWTRVEHFLARYGQFSWMVVMIVPVIWLGWYAYRKRHPQG